MSNDETSRFRWPFPARDADWQKWQDTFGDLISNVDSTMFSAVDGTRLIFKDIPNAEIVSNGSGYDLVMSGNLVMQSRAHGVEITVPVGAYPLTSLAVAAITSTPGAIGSQLISWEMLEGGVESSPNVIPLGYVNENYGITWWNGAQLFAGTGSLPLFGTAAGGTGGRTAIGLSRATANTTPTKLALVTGSLDTAINEVYYGEMILAAKEDDTAGTPGGLKSWSIRFTARHDADGNVAVLSPVDITVINSTSISDEASWALSSIAIDGASAGDPIEVFVVGGAATVSWSASINMVTVAELTP